MQQNVLKYKGILLPYLPNFTEAKTMECYKMIYKLILAPAFRNISIHFVN